MVNSAANEESVVRLAAGEEQMHIKSRDMSQGISLLLGFQAPVLSDWLFRPLSERSADSLKRKRVAFSTEHGSSTHFGCDSQWR